MVITRKIEVRVDASDKEELNVLWKKLRDMNYYVYRASNQVISDYHMANMLALQTRELPKDERRAIQENAFQFIYGSVDGYKDGTDNRIYQRLRQTLPELPSNIAAAISRSGKAQYQADMRNGLATGRRSVRNYKLGMPIPAPSRTLCRLALEEGVLRFTFCGIPFATVNLHKDKSNYTMVAKYYADIRDSKLVIDGTKVYLLASFDIDVSKKELDPKKVVGVDVGIKYPAVLAISEGFGAQFLGDIRVLKKKIALDKQYNRRKSNIVVKGGHGRRVVDKVTNEASGKERAFAKNLNHKLSRQIIDFAVKHGAGTVNMEALSFAEDQKRFAKTMRYWGYAELQGMVEYKAKRAGIVVQYVDSHYTSQTCSACGHVDSENRKTQERFVCTKCGHTMNADLNAAINIARSTKISTRSGESDSQ